MIEQMSIDEKIGQILMVGFQGFEPTEGIKEMIQKYRVGSIITFPRNVKTRNQIKGLLEFLKVEAAESGHHLPLLTTTDQEGGRVAHRIGDDTPRFPGNMALGATDSEKTACEVAKRVGYELRSSGYNSVLAPSLDINSNFLNPVIGVRSFGDTETQVSKMGCAFIKGLQAGGVASVAKHFPGHGDTETDSHVEMPSVHLSLEQLRDFELVPFKHAVQAGVDMIMTSHIYFSKIEEEGTPATFSKKILQEVLRKELEFKGVIISDCLEMNAISKTIGSVEAAVKAFLAGVDLLIVSHTYEVQKAVFHRLKMAVEIGEISEARLNESVQRIINLKQSIETRQKEADENRGHEEADTLHREFASNVMENAITVVKNEKQLIPFKLLDEERIVVINAATEWQSPELYEEKGAQTLPDEITKFHKNIKVVKLFKGYNATDLHHICQEAEKIVVMTSNAYLHQEEAELVRKITETYSNVVVVAFYNPYDILVLPRAHTYVVTYEPSMLAAEVVADVLFGKRQAKGKLPIKIPKEYLVK